MISHSTWPKANNDTYDRSMDSATQTACVEKHRSIPIPSKGGYKGHTKDPAMIPLPAPLEKKKPVCVPWTFLIPSRAPAYLFKILSSTGLVTTLVYP